MIKIATVVTTVILIWILMLVVVRLKMKKSPCNGNPTYVHAYFTGRPDLPPWVPKAMNVPNRGVGEDRIFWGHDVNLGSPFYERFSGVFVEETMLHLWWSYGMLYGRPRSRT